MDRNASMEASLLDLHERMLSNLATAGINLHRQLLRSQDDLALQIQHAHANVAAQMTRAQTDVFLRLQRAQANAAPQAQQASRVDEVERKNERLETTLAQKRAELETHKKKITLLMDAHAKLDARARQMKSWITHAQRIHPDLKAFPFVGQSSSEPVPARHGNTYSKNIRLQNTHETDVSLPAHHIERSRLFEQSKADKPTEPSASTRNIATSIDSDPSGASTESAPSEANQTQQEPAKPTDQSDSDVPQVVFERKLKRKRSRGPAYIKPEPLPQRVSSPSSPVPSATLDLDEVSLPLGNDSTLSTPPTGTSSKENRRIPTSSSAKRTRPKDSIAAAAKRRLNIYEDPKDAATVEISGANRIKDARPDARFTSSYRQESALQPKTPNGQVSMGADNIRSALQKRELPHINDWVNVLGEHRDEAQDENVDKADLSHPSLEELLKTPTVREYKPAIPPQRLETPSNTSRSRPHARSAKPARVQSLATPSTNVLRPAPATAPGPGLRARALEHLRLEDFKLNPSRNDGEDFAFSEVVRNREQRKCLPGCTKPDCCGSTFTRAVQIGGFSTPSRPGLGDALRGNEADEDDRLIRNYLGGGASRMECMSGAEREDILLKAKAAAFGQFHGKHRHLHPRPPSPVGFWRTDMPSTQEMLDDKAEAEKREHDKIRERWQEATKPNGLWIFRDECPPTTSDLHV